MKKLLLLCVVLGMWMMGCGSETSGSLSVSAPTLKGNDVVTATAKYTPSSGSALPDQNITFRWYAVGVTTKNKSSELTQTVSTDSTGTATSTYILPSTRTESYLVYVSASTGDLINTEGLQSVQVAP